MPAGQAIMGGLAKGLASGFGVVQDVIADANSELVDGLSGQVVGVGVRSCGCWCSVECVAGG